MLLFGPVWDAAHGGKANPWMSVLVGSFGLVSSWVTYFRRRGQDPRVELDSVIGVSIICAVILGIGLWNMPDRATGLVSLIIIVLFVLAIFGLAASPYGDWVEDWVRDFYAKRNRLQTLFGEDKKSDDKPSTLI